MKKEEDRISTYDMNIATVAIANGYRLIEVDKLSHPHKALFIFDKTDDLLKLIDDFYTDNLSINPRLLFDSLKAIKSRLYSEY